MITETFPFLLLGNKSDLGSKVTESTVKRFLEQRGWENVMYLETSAKHNTNIKESFQQVAKLCLKNTSQDLLYVCCSVFVVNGGYLSMLVF